MHRYMLLFFYPLTVLANSPEIVVRPRLQYNVLSLNREMTTISTPAALDNLPTTYVSNTSPGQETAPMIQGLPATQTTVVLDDITLNTPLSGTADLSPMLSGSTKGQLFPLGALDVPGASTGSVLTLSSMQLQEGQTLSWHVEGGAPTQLYHSFQLGEKNPTSSYLMMMENFMANGFPRRGKAPKFGANNPCTKNSFSLTGHTILGKKWVLDGRVRHVISQLSTQLDANISDAPQDEVTGILDIGRFKLSQINSTYQQSFVLGGFIQDAKYAHINLVPTIHRYDRLESHYNLFTSLWANTETNIALRVSRETLARKKNYKYNAHILHMAKVHQDFQIKGCLDVIHQNRFSLRIRSGMEVTYNMGPDMSFMIAYKNGVRYPTLYDLFGMGNLRGNKKLQPETSHTVRAVLAYTTSSVLFNISPFATEIQNMIVGVQTRKNQYQRQNHHMSVWGSTVMAEWRMSQGSIRAEYSLAAVRPAIGQPKIYPKHKATLIGIWVPNAHISWRNALVWVGSRQGKKFEGDREKVLTLTPYTLLSSHVQYSVDSQISWYMRLDNLLNTQYENIPDWATRGRSVYVGFRMRF